MAGMTIRHFVLAMLATGALAGCAPGQNPFAVVSGDDTQTGAAPAAATSVKLVDRDVEAPEVFQVTDEALWDGRPSLGGVWVASPDAVDPERVILRNPANGKFVIGALFRRERDNPGPALQISSDAAAALGMLAGQPASLNVTALRREEVPITAPDATNPILDAAETVETTTLDPVAAVAGAAIDAAEGKAGGPAPQTPPKPLPETADETADETAADIAADTAEAVATTPASGTGSLIQIGIFSVEANARRAVDTLAKSGITADIRKEESQGKTFWSVTTRGDAATLAKIKSAGFADAYVLKR